MAKPIDKDLHVRVVAAIEAGASRRAAARRQRADRNQIDAPGLSR
jgi:hypothetical protein